MNSTQICGNIFSVTDFLIDFQKIAIKRNCYFFGWFCNSYAWLATPLTIGTGKNGGGKANGGDTWSLTIGWSSEFSSHAFAHHVNNGCRWYGLNASGRQCVSLPSPNEWERFFTTFISLASTFDDDDHRISNKSDNDNNPEIFIIWKREFRFNFGIFSDRQMNERHTGNERTFSYGFYNVVLWEFTAFLMHSKPVLLALI